MTIYTSYFARIKKHSDILPIAICAKPPKGFNGPVLSELAPTFDILMQYKETGDEARYIARFNDEILGLISPQAVYCLIEDIAKANNADKVALVCFEKSGDFCHRHLVSVWLNNALGLTIEELK